MQQRIGFLVTCLVDFFRPSVGFAALDLLERADCRVIVPRRWTCCGQPGYNSGDRKGARAVARAIVEGAEDLDALVVPSASCAGMIRNHYPDLFAGTDLADRARTVAAKTHELFAFLVDQQGDNALEASFPHRVTYHDSCSALREMGVVDQPRKLMARVEGLELCEAPEPDRCCGFGGTFCVKYTQISDHMATARARAFEASGAEVLLGGDLGCLLNLAGKLRRMGSPLEVRHLAEVLAGRTDGPALGAVEV